MWILLSLLTAILAASADAWSKRFFGNRGFKVLALAPLVYSLPFLIITSFFIPRPELNYKFWLSIFLGVPLNILSYFLYMKAILVSPFSLSLPFLAFTPVFTVLTGYLILGETINLIGLLGIFMVVIGAYVLNVTSEMKDILMPIKAIFKEKGSILMAFVSLFFSFGAVIGKLGIVNSSVMFFGCFFFITQNILILSYYALKERHILRDIVSPGPKIILVGLLYYMHIFLHNYAISMVEVSYMIAIKRLSILFGMLYGLILFKEENLRFRLTGGLIMVLGAGLVALSKALL